MVARNDITGDAIQSRSSSKAFSDNYDLIFRKKEQSVIDKVSSEETLDKTENELPTTQKRVSNRA
jgi:hypothetical protein